jgi:hypothetical protein
MNPALSQLALKDAGFPFQVGQTISPDRFADPFALHQDCFVLTQYNQVYLFIRIPPVADAAGNKGELLG